MIIESPYRALVGPLLTLHRRGRQAAPGRHDHGRAAGVHRAPLVGAPAAQPDGAADQGGAPLPPRHGRDQRARITWSARRVAEDVDQEIRSPFHRPLVTHCRGGRHAQRRRSLSARWSRPFRDVDAPRPDATAVGHAGKVYSPQIAPESGRRRRPRAVRHSAQSLCLKNRPACSERAPPVAAR